MDDSVSQLTERLVTFDYLHENEEFRTGRDSGCLWPASWPAVWTGCRPANGG